jgi:hypothetical protein
MLFDYAKICQNLIENVPPRTKEIISRRFGLKTDKKETLEAIGKDYGITRERVRQIEEDGFLKIEPKIGQFKRTFQYFTDQFKNFGDLKKEDILLQELGGRRFQPQIYFLLTLGPNFEKVGESDEFYSLWTINQNSLVLAKKVIDSFYNQLKKNNRPLGLKNYNQPATLALSSNKQVLLTYLEISKKIQKGPEGLFGLKDWPEINPKGVKDKAYLAFKKTKRPLHFSQVAELIDKALPQTVHNELIRDERFILVGRGIYALREWGYEPGQVKDIIFKILKKTGKPLTKEEILKKVLQQRLVKENTVLLNLSNKKYFLKASRGYTIRKA